VLHVPLALTRDQHIHVMFRINEPFQPIAFGKAIDQAFPVLPNTAGKLSVTPR
jgi:hypothetical protein